MEYYAKSKTKELLEKEKRKLIDLLQRAEEMLAEDLTESEKKAIEQSIYRIENTVCEKQKTLKAHEEEIVACAKTFFEKYGHYFTEKERKLVIEACRLHDLGKVNQIFQSIVSPERKKETDVQQIPHGFLSALSVNYREFREWSAEFSEDDFRAAITAIYYHHDREDHYDADEIQKYAKDYYLNELEQYAGKKLRKLYVSNLGKLLFRNMGTEEKLRISETEWEKYLLIKGLLNKFDYAVSAGYTEAEIEPDLEKKELKKKVQDYLAGKELRPAQKYMMEHAEENLIVIAPTGSGKTEAALLWLNGEKGFYTLPLKVSSNAIYDRIRYRYGYENAALLHSDSMSVYLSEEGTEADEKYHRAKMLAWPVTVCTVDQLLKFSYRALGTEIFAATLKYSKLILDEIQSYSPDIIATILYSLVTIQRLGGKFAIVTATFPPVLTHFMERYGLCEEKQYHKIDFSEGVTQIRHKIQIRFSEMDVEEILEQGKTKKVLVICNTIASAQKLYAQLEKRTEEVWLLHSCFLRRDRRRLENKILRFSGEPEKNGIWISTQIVEASLDIDFDVLHTEMCTADSLLQRLGRCNRSGRYIPEEANVIVYVNRNGVGEHSVYDEFLYDRSVDYLKEYEDITFSEQMKTEYMNQVYAAEEIKNSEYYKEIELALKKLEAIHCAEYTKKEVDKQFRGIESITVMPDRTYDENQEFIEKSVEILSTAHVDQAVKTVFRKKLEDLAVSVSGFKGKKMQVDQMTIGQKDQKRVTNIHRASVKYEFDEDTCRGRGLVPGEEETGNFFEKSIL